MKLDLSFEKTRIEINQLYHPTARLKVDFYEQVYSKDTLNKNKFAPIALKEWFYLVKKGGLLIIDYIPNRICDQEKLKNMMLWLWKGRYQIISHKNIDSRRLRFICKKTVSTSIKGDDINKWTFGIITNGKRNEWVNLIINSIRGQRIKNYEIIICGTYTFKKAKDIRYIPFNLRDTKGWITKKKNLIVKKAKYENICMLHDRMILDKEWFGGMKKWGNCFENLGCIQLYENIRVNDWLTSHYFIKTQGDQFSFESYVDYKDWYPSIWFLGQFNIFKKSIIIKNNLFWNEKLYYGEREDYNFSKKLNDYGFIHRFNKFSKVITLTNKYVNPTWIKYNPNSLIPNMKLDNLNSFLKFTTFSILKTINLLGIRLSFATLENTRGKIYTFILMFNPKRFIHNKEWRKVIKR